jgi:hypothetical protein
MEAFVNRMDSLLNRSTPPQSGQSQPRIQPATTDGGSTSSAPPSSTPPGSSGGSDGGGQIEHEPESIQKLGENIEEQVGKLIEQAHSALEEAKISEDAFSTSGWLLAAAYPGAHEFFVMDAESKHKHMDTVKAKLANTAKHWRTAEEKSTVRT